MRDSIGETIMHSASKNSVKEPIEKNTFTIDSQQRYILYLAEEDLVFDILESVSRLSISHRTRLIEQIQSLVNISLVNIKDPMQKLEPNEGLQRLKFEKDEQIRE